MAQLRREPILIECEGWDGYRLLDSGAGRKFEAFGPHAYIRPETQAKRPPRLPQWIAAGE